MGYDHNQINLREPDVLKKLFDRYLFVVHIVEDGPISDDQEQGCVTLHIDI